MSDFVVDASALPQLSAAIPSGSRLYAPELIDLEVMNLVRKAVLRRQITESVGSATVRAWATNDVVRVSHRALLARVWQLRDNITPYDAAYVALAQELTLPLVTADRRLAAAASRYCEVITVG